MREATTEKRFLRVAASQRTPLRREACKVSGVKWASTARPTVSRVFQLA